MTVYIDHARAPFRSMLMSHMIADTREELLEMACKIGLDYKWLQYVGTTREHFDVCESKRALAIRCGAVALSRDAFQEKFREQVMKND